MFRCCSRRGDGGVYRVLAELSAVVLLLAGRLSAQPASRAAAFDGERYDRAVLAYRDGRVDEGVSALVTLTAEGFKELRRWWFAGDLPKRRFTPEDVVASAGMLHTDCALALYEKGPSNLAEEHLRLGRDLVWLSRMERLDPAPPEGFLRRWHLAAALIPHGYGYFDKAGWYLDRALDEWPDDVPLLVERGAVEEAWATLPAAHPGWVDSARRFRNDHLNKAELALERAVTLDGSRIEAVIRLASVRVERGRHEEARAALEALEASRPPPEFSYLANLALGGLDERDGRLDEAVARYTAAIKAYPISQAARTALAAVLRRLNRTTDALAVVRESLALQFADGTADPWWGYYTGRLVPFDELIAWLREEARR